MHQSKKRGAAALARFALIVAALAWGVRSFGVAPFSIPSSSMLPNLYVGDYVMAAKWPYGFSRYSFPFELPAFSGRVLGDFPARGDVVVFHHPGEDTDLIKRVIGLPGDTVEMRRGMLFLNGKIVARRPLPPLGVPISANSPCRKVTSTTPAVVTLTGNRQVCVYRAYLETLPGGPSYTIFDQIDGGVADDFPRVTVPAGRIFLMGDNRDDSLDSRFAASAGGIGMVPAADLIGRASFTFWSTDGSASYMKPWTWFTSLRGRRIGNDYKGMAE